MPKWLLQIALGFFSSSFGLQGQMKPFGANAQPAAEVLFQVSIS
jgi:hypothetical protein